MLIVYQICQWGGKMHKFILRVFQEKEEVMIEVAPYLGQ